MTDTTIATPIPGFTLPDIPRRFALCEYDEDDTLPLYMWGIHTATEAFGFFADGSGTGHSTSAESIESMHSMTGAIELIWLDAPPPLETRSAEGVEDLEVRGEGLGYAAGVGDGDAGGAEAE